jgi:hypothetical protein
VTVRVVRVDMERSRIDFVLPGEDATDPGAAPRKRRPGARRLR